MTHEAEIEDRISTLRTEAASAGDTAQVELCDKALAARAELYDDSDKRVTPEALGVELSDYVGLIVESLECPQAEGWICVRGRNVYAY